MKSWHSDLRARPRVGDEELDEAYQSMATDVQREAEALEWAENLIADVASLATRRKPRRSAA